MKSLPRQAAAAIVRLRVCVVRILNAAVVHWALWCAANPWWAIWASLCLTGLCSLGFLRFHIVTDIVDLWVPTSSTAFQNSLRVRDFFLHATAQEFIVVEKTPGAGVFSEAAMEEQWRLHDCVVTAAVAGGPDHGELCFRLGRDSTCFIDSVLKLWEFNRTAYDAVASAPGGVAAAIGESDGWLQQLVGSSASGARGRVADASALRSRYLMAGWKATRDWEVEFLRCCGVTGVPGIPTQVQRYDHIDVYVNAARSLDDEFLRVIMIDLWLVATAYALMITFCWAVLCGQAVRRPMVVTFGGVTSIAIAVVSSFGLCSAFGLPFSALLVVLPCLMLGIGVDDMFVMVSQLGIVHASAKHGSDRLGLALRRCALSLIYTSVTDFFAFLLGAVSSLPAVRHFCIYASVSICSVFFFQVTFFVGILSLDASQQVASAGDSDLASRSGAGARRRCFCLPRRPNAEAHVKDRAAPTSVAVELAAPSPEAAVAALDEPTAFSAGAAAVAAACGGVWEIAGPWAGNGGGTGGALEDRDLEADGLDGTAAAAAPEPAPAATAPPPSAEDAPPTRTPLQSLPMQCLGRFLKDVYAPALSRRWLQALVLAMFAVITALNFYFSLWRVTEGFEFIDMTPDQSYLRDFLSQSDRWQLTARNFQIDTGLYLGADSAYWDPAWRLDLDATLQGLHESDHMTEYLMSWFHALLAWADARGGTESSTCRLGCAEEEFWPLLHAFLADNALESSGRGGTAHYWADLAWRPDGKLKASRLHLQHSTTDTVREQIAAMDTALESLDQSPLRESSWLSSSAYLYITQFKVISEEMFTNFACNLVAVGLASLLLIPQPLAVLMVILMLVAIDIDLVGALHLLGLQINSVSLIQLVTAVGLIVDYMAHIVHFFLLHSLESPGATAGERLKHSLGDIGPSVLLGGTTTMLGILPLAMASSWLFRSFFKMYLTIVLCAMFHAFIVVPVFLLLLGIAPIAEVDHAEAASVEEVREAKAEEKAAESEEAKEEADAADALAQEAHPHGA